MEAETPAAPVTPPKVDPETLVLRARPQLAARFRRGVIIGAAAVGAGGVATLGYVALRPHIQTAGDQESDLSQPARSGTPDALSGLPSSYGAVPKLGPPLPGDLGKPILQHQQSTLVTDAGQQPTVAENALGRSSRRRWMPFGRPANQDCWCRRRPAQVHRSRHRRWRLRVLRQRLLLVSIPATPRTRNGTRPIS